MLDLDRLRQVECSQPSWSACEFHALLTRVEEIKNQLTQTVTDALLDEYVSLRHALTTLLESGWTEQVNYQNQGDVLRGEFTVDDLKSQLIKKYNHDASMFAEELITQKVSIPKIGDAQQVATNYGDNFGSPTCEEDGISTQVVFEVNGRLFRMEGYYSSWDGHEMSFESIQEVVGHATQIHTEITTEWLVS